MLEDVVDRFNEDAEALQRTEFRRPRTPGEWHRLAGVRSSRDYTKLAPVVVPLIDSVLAAPQNIRNEAAARMNLDARGILRTFAWGMSVEAVRKVSPELIEQGLKALVVLGSIDDFRDLIFYLALLHHSALKLGLDAKKLFDQTAFLMPVSDFQREVRGFPSRPPLDRDLSAFNLQETLLEGRFDFVEKSR